MYPNRVLEIGLFMFRNRESQMCLLLPGSIRNRVPSTVVRMGIVCLWRREMSHTKTFLCYDRLIVLKNLYGNALPSPEALL